MKYLCAIATYVLILFKFIILGRIVNVSSILGRQSWPGRSAYHISKHGIETMSDSLRLEMVKFGVVVSIIEPGNYGHATSIAAKVAVFVNSRYIQYIEIYNI